MKIKNTFTKTVKKAEKASIETLDKKQLEKVLGGIETRNDNKPVKALDTNPTI